MIYSIYRLVIAFSVSFTCLLEPSVTCLDARISLKETFHQNYRSIVEGTQNFRDFVIGSSAFIDKSLLLREVLNDTINRVVTINYPHGWGKSLNLHMIKLFLEIEVDAKGMKLKPHENTPNYRLFKKGEVVLSNGDVQKLQEPLLIGDDYATINEYQGKIPVIYLNLSALNPGNSFDDLYAEIVHRISDSFAEHEYMKEVFYDIMEDINNLESEKLQAQTNLDLYKKILWKKADVEEVQKSLNFLSKILCDHFQKEVFILVDGYDAPFNNTFLSNTFRRSHEKMFLDFYRKLNFYTFISNPNMKRSILTGVIPLAKGSLFSGFNDVREITVLKDSNIHNYYGFSKVETKELFELFDVGLNATAMCFQFYEAYAIGPTAKMALMEPSCVTHVINTRDMKRSDCRFLYKYSEVDSIRHALAVLLSGLYLPIDFKNITLNKEDFKHLQNVPYYNEVTYGPIVQAFLRYIFACGYVSLSEVVFVDKICVRFSTAELYATLGEALMNFYGNKFGFSTKVVRPICMRFREVFEEFAKSENRTSTKLTATLERFYACIFRPHGFITNENEEMTHMVMDYLFVFAHSFKRYPSYGTEFLLFGDNLAIVVETTFNSSTADAALQKARKSKSKFDPLHFPKMRFIGINAKPNSTVHVLAANA